MNSLSVLRRPSPNPIRGLGALFLGLVLASVASAATVTWDADANNGFWDGVKLVTGSPNKTNWSNEGYPGAGDIARFHDGSLNNTVRAIDLVGNRTVSSLTFNSATSGYTLDTAVSKHQLTLNAGAITVEDGAHTIYSDLVLGANATWSINSGDSLAVNGVVSGSANLIKTGGGTLGLGGANTYTGTTSISGGTLRLDANNVLPNSSAVTLTGTLSINGRTDSIHSLSGTGTLNLAGGTLTILNTSSFNGQMDVGGAGTSTIVVPSGVTYTHNSVGGGASNDIGSVNPDSVSLAFDVGGTAIIEVPINVGFGTGNLIKTGAGTLSLLSDASGYRGSTLIRNGTLVISSVTDLVSGNTSSIGNGSWTNIL